MLDSDRFLTSGLRQQSLLLLAFTMKVEKKWQVCMFHYYCSLFCKEDKKTFYLKISLLTLNSKHLYEAMFKRKGYDAEEFPDEEDEPLYTNCRDALKVYFISFI